VDNPIAVLPAGEPSGFPECPTCPYRLMGPAWICVACASKTLEAIAPRACPVCSQTAVRVVAQGDSLISPSMTRKLVAEFASRAKEPHPAGELDAITQREREVMALVADGLTNDEIARKLYMSPATVRTHVSRAMTKLGVRDRAQLVVLAYETGLVRPNWLT
jgi:DNA-binding NarL/FixJ family response regulator